MAIPMKACSHCKHWTATDKSLDGGRDLLGTCHRFQDYEHVSNAVYRGANWTEAGYLAGMRKTVKEEGALLQILGEDPKGVRAYLRTAATFSCASFESKVAAPAPSLTAGRSV